MKNWYDIDFRHVDTPALVVDKDKVSFNIDLALKYAGGAEYLRPHVKTHKILEVAKMQMAAGINKFKCATIPEAEMLGMAGARDVLIAYPVQGPKIDRVLKLIEKFSETRYQFLLDNVKCAEEIQRKCQINGLSVDVFIDVNNGQNRTGIKIDFIRNLIDELGNFSNIKIVGLHCYDGHIRMASLEDRTQNCRSAFEKVLELQEELQSILNREINLVAGGSPSFSVHAKHHKVECSPGTFIFWDQRYANNYKEQAFKKAVVVATRVISKLDAFTYCLDLGHKSVASEFPFPRVAFIDASELNQIGHSEEHLILKSKEPDVLEPGQLLFAYPFHVCPTVALYDHVQVVSNGKIIDQWEVIARNRKITI